MGWNKRGDEKLSTFLSWNLSFARIDQNLGLDSIITVRRIGKTPLLNLENFARYSLGVEGEGPPLESDLLIFITKEVFFKYQTSVLL